MSESIQRPYWILGTHFGHTSVRGRFATADEALAAIEKLEAEYHHTLDLYVVRDSCVGDADREAEYWTTSPVRDGEILCGRYTSDEYARDAARACRQISGQVHYILEAKRFDRHGRPS